MNRHKDNNNPALLLSLLLYVRSRSGLNAIDSVIVPTTKEKAKSSPSVGEDLGGVIELLVQAAQQPVRCVLYNGRFKTAEITYDLSPYAKLSLC